MKFRSFRYYLKESITNLFRNSVMSIVSVLTVTCCILMFVLMFAIAVNVDFMLHQLSSTLGFNIVVSDDATAAEKDTLYTHIQNTEHVAGVRFISADEGLMDFIESLGDDGDTFLDLVDSNPLPHKFEIHVDDPRYMEIVVRNIVNIGGDTVEQVVQQTPTVNALIAFNRAVRIASVVIVAVFISISIVIIINTIKLTVNNRQTEIGIMKYVGATDWFIRWPFIIEGILIGIIGALIATVAFSYVYTLILNADAAIFDIIGELVLLRPAYEMLPLTSFAAIPMGIAIGATASIVSVRRYLKV